MHRHDSRDYYLSMACAVQRNQVRIRSDGLLIKGKYSLAKIFVMSSHFVKYRDSQIFVGGGGVGMC